MGVSVVHMMKDTLFFLLVPLRWVPILDSLEQNSKSWCPPDVIGLQLPSCMPTEEASWG